MTASRQQRLLPAADASPTVDGQNETTFQRLAEAYAFALSGCSTQDCIDDLERRWLDQGGLEGAVAIVANPQVLTIAAGDAVAFEHAGASMRLEMARRVASLRAGLATLDMAASEAMDVAAKAYGEYEHAAARAAEYEIRRVRTLQALERADNAVNNGPRKARAKKQVIDVREAASIRNQLAIAPQPWGLRRLLRRLRRGLQSQPSPSEDEDSSPRVAPSLVQATAAARRLEAEKAAWDAQISQKDAEAKLMIAEEFAVLAEIACSESEERRAELAAHERQLAEDKEDVEVVGEAFGGLSSAVGSAAAEAIAGFFAGAPASDADASAHATKMDGP